MSTDAYMKPDLPALRLCHTLLVYVTPSRLFARVEDTGTYGWALAVLLGAVVLLGYVQVQTGLIDRTVDEQTQTALAAVEANRGQLQDRVRLTKDLESARQQGEFTKTLARLGALVIAPISILASVLLISAVFYAIVALSGRKPEYHTLMSIVTYSAFIELAAYVLQVVMIVYYRTLDVGTSLGALWPGAGPSPLQAVDPFRIWFWVLTALGLMVTRQLSKRAAIASCVIMCLIAVGARVGIVYAAAQ